MTKVQLLNEITKLAEAKHKEMVSNGKWYKRIFTEYDVAKAAEDKGYISGLLAISEIIAKDL
jgi:hypothetical protein